ncbi:MAG: hypothetical protein WBP08_14970 [Saprospiraceae bacterium]|nr:hypothetical protein [Saprospiraceae bacterium]
MKNSNMLYFVIGLVITVGLYLVISFVKNPEHSVSDSENSRQTENGKIKLSADFRKTHDTFGLKMKK